MKFLRAHHKLWTYNVWTWLVYSIILSAILRAGEYVLFDVKTLSWWQAILNGAAVYAVAELFSQFYKRLGPTLGTYKFITSVFTKNGIYATSRTLRGYRVIKELRNFGDENKKENIYEHMNTNGYIYEDIIVLPSWKQQEVVGVHVQQ